MYAMLDELSNQMSQVWTRSSQLFGSSEILGVNFVACITLLVLLSSMVYLNTIIWQRSNIPMDIGRHNSYCCGSYRVSICISALVEYSNPNDNYFDNVVSLLGV